MISAILPKKNYLQKSCKTVYNTFRLTCKNMCSRINISQSKEKEININHSSRQVKYMADGRVVIETALDSKDFEKDILIIV